MACDVLGIDCGSDRSVPGPDDVLGASRIGGGDAQVYATFFPKRPVSAECLLIDIPYGLVLSAYIEKYEVPRIRAEDGLSGFGMAVCSGPCCRLITVDSLGWLCIGKIPRA